MSSELTTPATRLIIPEYHWIHPLPNSPEMSASSGYRMTFVTDTTTKMDRRFGLDLSKPGEITEDAAYKLRAAVLFTSSAESMRVVEYFTWWAKNLNFFHAFPFEEIPDATNGGISWHDMEVAFDEGQLDFMDFPEWDVQVAQLTPTFGQTTHP